MSGPLAGQTEVHFLVDATGTGQYVAGNARLIGLHSGTGATIDCQ